MTCHRNPSPTHHLNELLIRSNAPSYGERNIVVVFVFVVVFIVVEVVHNI